MCLPLSPPSLSAPTGTREAAFVYALSAATISHTIARACTSGDLRLCSCGPIPAQVLEPGYRWGGCADNLHYGLIMGSKFSDAPMKMKRAGSHASKLMHLHNSEVGRQVSTYRAVHVSRKQKEDVRDRITPKLTAKLFSKIIAV